ncbi:MAG: TolC family protein, partial [Pirellulales bacterium]|nr:TolC family protein [Pirellulales bacterium]
MPRGRLGIVGTSTRILLGATALFAVSVVPAGGETLYEALTATYEGNPGLEAERERQRADEENVRQAIADWLPTVSLDAEHGDEQNHTMPQNTRSHLEPEGYGLTLTQPIFKGFRTLNGKRKADAETQAGRFQLDNTEQTTLLNAVTAYVDVLRDRKIARLRRDNVRYLQTELKASQVRHRAGDLSKTDVAQARTRVYEGKADLALANAERAASEARYVAVIGHAAGSLTRPPIPDHLLP